MQGQATISNDSNLNFVSATQPNAFVGIGFLTSGGTERAIFKINWGSGEIRIGNTTGGGYFPTFYSNAAERMRILGNGNVLINTTTDAGYKLDVNGTARVKGTGTTSATTAFTVQNSAGTTMLSVKDGGADKVVTMPSAVIASIDISSTIIQVGGGNSIRFIATGHAFNNNYATPHSSAIMDVSSTTKGFLPPRMTTTEKNAIATPATGLQVHDTTLNRPCFYDGTTWITL